MLYIVDVLILLIVGILVAQRQMPLKVALSIVAVFAALTVIMLF